MALCLAESLLERSGFDAADQMTRYVRWWKEGYLSATGTCFDIGSTVRQALSAFVESGNPFSGSVDPQSAGNGSIMRLAPVPMFFAPDEKAAVHFAAESSRTTHGCPEAVDACRLFSKLLVNALAGAGKNALLAAGKEMATTSTLSPSIAAIAEGRFLDKARERIRGTGYVVESLEAALWCLFHSDGFEEAILKAANLGDDADTTAAVCGQIAGALWGEGSIPGSWLERLTMRETIRDFADALESAKP